MRPLVLALSFLLATTTASASDELKLIAERQSLTATWRTYRQVIDGVEVYGTDVIQRIDPDGSVHEVHRATARRSAHRPLIAAAEARAHLPAGRVASQALAALNVDGEARPVWRVVVEERPMEPVAHYIDAATGAVLRREPLFWSAQARVFDVNPVAKLNRPDLQDNNNAATAVPPEAYSDVELDNVAPSGMLTGPNVTIVDTQAPFTTDHADASQPLIFDRSQAQFEEVNAYFQLDRSAKYMQSLGYAGPRRIVAYSIPVDPHAANGSDNSFYISNATNGTGALFFGDGGTNDAQDSDIMLHEFGHAIQDWIAPGAFSGESSSQSRAMGEGFGDYWSFSSTYAATSASGRDPFCIGDWDARCANDDPSQHCGYALGADCLRRVDSNKTMADFNTLDSPGVEHLNGEIWSSALREIFLAIGKQQTDTLVLESTFGVAPNTTYAGFAKHMIEVDRALYGGVHAATICGAMTKRGILTDCVSMPRGELTVIQSNTRALPLPATGTTVVTDDRSIAKLMVRVDIQHPSRGDLQIVLTGPDGTSVALQKPSLDRVPDLHATFGFDVEPSESLSAFVGKSAIGTWQLTVTDTRGSGVGVLQSWALEIVFANAQPFAVRPSVFTPRLHIAAAAHTDGLAGSQWRSDLFLLNRGPLTADLTLLFTPSGADGSTNFGAVNVEVDSQETVALRDVVAQLFRTTGSGTIEIQGDLQQLVAWSRTYDAARGLSETIEPSSSSDSIGANDAPLIVYPLTAATGGRANIGLFETAGGSGTATVRMAGFGVEPVTLNIPIAPFSHVQVGTGPMSIAYVSVTGDARINAYGSVINAVGDPTFIPARVPRAMDAIVPVVAETQWMTQLWIGGTAAQPSVRAFFYTSHGIEEGTLGASSAATLPQFAGTAGAFGVSIPDGVIVSTRIDNAGRGDRIDPIPFEEAKASTGGDIIRIEHDSAYRTNLGATETNGNSATVRFFLFDAAGNLLGSIDKKLGSHQQLQFSLSEIRTAPLTDGRVRVAVVGDSDHVVGYASVVDNRSGDSEFVRAR